MKNILIHLFYTLLVRPLLTLIIGVRFENTEVLSKTKQFIIVGNHNSHLDAVSIRSVLPAYQKKNTYTIAAKDYFGTSSMSCKAMTWFLNAVLIRRERVPHEPSAIEILDDCLKKGKSLILFPEGSRGQAGVITEFKKGIAVLLKRHPNLHFIPTYINGFGRILPKDSNLCLPLPCKIRFGEPMKSESQDIDDILQQVRTAILDLKPAEEREMNRFQADF